MRYYTRDFIEWQLLTSDMWLERGMLAIYRRQNANSQGGVILPNRGFSHRDDRILSSFAQQLRTGHLSPKQLVIARQLMPKYTGQLTQMANGTR